MLRASNFSLARARRRMLASGGTKTPRTSRRKNRAKSAECPSERTAGRRLDEFIAKFTPDMAIEIRETLERMRAKLPGAVELVYDNYNALAIGFASGERLADV
jgi:hypothetical protein